VAAAAAAAAGPGASEYTRALRADDRNRERSRVRRGGQQRDDKNKTR